MSQSSPMVIVTGGGRGLGAAIIADLLASGYGIATCSRTKSELIERWESEAAGRFFWAATRIGDAQEEERFAGQVKEWLHVRPLWGLINNAGIAGEGILATYPNVNSEEIMQVNLLGAIRMARLVLRMLISQNTPGRIINISSIIGSRGYTGLSVYAASKAGMDGLTRSLAREVGRRGITVNSVAPGYLETEMSASLEQNQRQQIVRRTPMARLGATADVTPLVRFLLSEEARFITGQTVIVDGGISC